MDIPIIDFVAQIYSFLPKSDKVRLTLQNGVIINMCTAKEKTVIRNNTRKTVISKNEKIVFDILGKATGLMFQTKVKTPLIFVFNPRQRIDMHMMLVFCSIDVILLDGKKKVVELRENLNPFTLFSSREKSKYVIELPSGAIRKSKTKVGDAISITNNKD